MHATKAQLVERIIELGWACDLAGYAHLGTALLTVARASLLSDIDVKHELLIAAIAMLKAAEAAYKPR